MAESNNKKLNKIKIISTICTAITIVIITIILIIVLRPKKIKPDTKTEKKKQVVEAKQPEKPMEDLKGIDPTTPEGYPPIPPTFSATLPQCVTEYGFNEEISVMMGSKTPKEAVTTSIKGYKELYKEHRKEIWLKMRQIKDLEGKEKNALQILQLQSQITESHVLWAKRCFPLFSLKDYYLPRRLTIREPIFRDTIEEQEKNLMKQEQSVTEERIKITDEANAGSLTDEVIDKIVMMELNNFETTIFIFQLRMYCKYGNMFLESKALSSSNVFEDPLYLGYMGNHLAFTLKIRFDMVHEGIQAVKKVNDQIMNQMKEKKATLRGLGKKHPTVRSLKQIADAEYNIEKMLETYSRKFDALSSRYNKVMKVLSKEESEIIETQSPEEKAVILKSIDSKYLRTIEGLNIDFTKSLIAFVVARDIAISKAGKETPKHGEAEMFKKNLAILESISFTEGNITSIKKSKSIKGVKPPVSKK